jgi:hypothetical protein
MINYEHRQKHEILYKDCRSVQWFTYKPHNVHFRFCFIKKCWVYIVENKKIEGKLKGNRIKLRCDFRIILNEEWSNSRADAAAGRKESAGGSGQAQTAGNGSHAREASGCDKKEQRRTATQADQNQN